MPQTNSGNSTLARICTVLNSFSEEEKTLTLTEISHRIHLPKSTTHRLLAMLVEQGMVYKDPDGRGFKLGFQLIRWGMLAQRSINFRDTALPILKKLSSLSGETVVLSVRDGNYGIWVEQIESEQAYRIAKREGVRLMLHAGASSKVLLAFLPPGEIEKIISQIELVPLQVKTITQKDKLRAELLSTRKQGYAVSFEETDRGAMGIAAPVFDHNNRLVAGIGIVAPITRVTPEQVPTVAKLVQNAAQELSIYLGATLSVNKQESRGGAKKFK